MNTCETLSEVQASQQMPLCQSNWGYKAEKYQRVFPGLVFYSTQPPLKYAAVDQKPKKMMNQYMDITCAKINATEVKQSKVKEIYGR